MRTAIPLVLFATVLVCPLVSDPAQAQRVFVSATGNDGNPCSFAAPCRSFQHAHDVSAANGEIDVLDPGGYGPVTITKAISIQGHGFSGISVPSGGTGITINPTVGLSTTAVHLNGLLIEGSQVGATGIAFLSGASLTVENCIVRNLTGDGLGFVPSATNPQKLAVSNSYFNDNFNGISFDPRNVAAAQPITASIDRTGFYNNLSIGLWVFGADGVGTLTVAVTDSTAANNGLDGFAVQSAVNQSATNLSLTHVLIEGNKTGVAVGSNATLWLAQSTLTGNTTAGFNNTGGTLNTFQDNYSTKNGSNTGSITTVGKF
jgi:hypothetical protein